MHSTRKITEDLVYIGGSDRSIVRFENLFPVPRGVSYNSYLLLDEKTVLFDTADKVIGSLFMENLTAALAGRPLDYVVVHHMEPDHCAMLSEVLRLWPEAKMVCSARVPQMIGQFFAAEDISTRVLVVAEGDKLSTGRHTLHFVMAPMVHWPEVMVTYDELSKILFSADAFGTFGALNGLLFDDEVGFDRLWMDDARRYYSNICGKYGAQVQALLKKAAALDIEMICPLHGPVWRSSIETLLEKYQKWSTWQPEGKGVMIAYATMYGDTENAAEVLASLLAERGVHDIALYDVSGTDVSVLVSESFRCSHLVLAAPTYNGGLHPRMEAYLADLKALDLRGRTVAMLENGTWAPVSARQMGAKLAEMKNMTVLDNTVSFRSSLQERAAIEALADVLAEQLK